MRKYLRDSGEFQHVYRNGKRYEGVFITAFVIENQELNHRLGVTASKKALGKAVQRNRAKRLLRETFRLSGTFLATNASRDYVALPCQGLSLKPSLQGDDSVPDFQ